MKDGYKIVVTTAAGRRRYMQYLIPQVLCSAIVDRYDILINTTNKQDIEFFKLLAKEFPKISLVYQPDGMVNGNVSINAFYKDYTDEDTIYIRLDDDIIWIEPDMLDKMVGFRLANPEYFFVSPLVINNALCTYVLHNAKKIRLNRYYQARATERILWGNGAFAVQLHKWFLDNYLVAGKYKELHCGKYPIALARFSINSIIWFGREMKKFNGIILGDEEEYLSVIKPAQLGLSNCINGDALAAHFAFFTQRGVLDKLNILERYGEYLFREWKNDETIGNISTVVQTIMQEVESRKEEIMNHAPIYTTPKAKIRHKILAFIKLKFLSTPFTIALMKVRQKKYIVG